MVNNKDNGVSKAAKKQDTKTLNLLRNIVSLQVFVNVSHFSPCMIKLSRNKNICCGLKNVVVKSRVQVYFEQQILALWLIFVTQQICLCPRKSTNQHAAFLQPATMFLLQVKLIIQGEKRETSTEACNETLLSNKLVVFVSRILPP